MNLQKTKFKNTELGEIPQDWEIVNVKSFLKITMGQSPSSDFYNEERKGLPFYQGVSDFGKTFPTPRIWCSNPQKIANKNEILFSVRAPVGETNLTNEKCCIGRGVASLTPIDSDLEYCYYLISEFKHRFTSYSQGTTFEAINRDEVGRVKLPFTSDITEQQNIASILSKVDHLLQKTDQIIEQTQRLRKGLMQRLLDKGISHTKFKNVISFFGKTEKIPVEWNIVNLGEIGKIRYGLSQPPKQSDNGVPMIRATNIKRGKIIAGDILRVIPDTVRKSIFLRVGDIIVVRSGVYTGDIGYVTKEFEGCLAGYDLCVTLYENINSLFLMYYLLSPRIQNYFSQLKSRVAQEHLNLRQLSEALIYLPPYEEQKKISTILADVDKIVQSQLNYKQKLGSIKGGLMENLLTGKIRVKTYDQ